MRFVQPRDLTLQLLAVARYLGREPALDRDLLDLACQSFFDLDAVETINTARFD
jgi:hypothetical protein